MESIEIILVLVAAMLVLLASGVWIGFALVGVAAISMALFSTRPGGDAMAVTIWGSLTSWTLTPLPLFIWMGEILFRSRISDSLFRALSVWSGGLPGRLLHVNVVGCAIFAAISGSSAATCATVGRVTVPELRRRNYPENVIVGSLAGSATLGLLIPPSIIMIVYGVAADVSISKLFIAGVVPGILLALLFMGYVGVWSLFNRSKIPPADAHCSFAERIRASAGLVPAMSLIVAVLGAIYSGIATPTEAAAVGVLGSLVVAMVQGGMGFKEFTESVMGAARTSAMIMLILAGSSFLTLAMGFTGMPRVLAEWIGTLNLSPAFLLVALTCLYVFLGCFLDGISMVVLTIAVLLPTLAQAGFDLVWFGIYLVLVVEMAQITPPVGFNLFVLQSMTGRSIGYVSKAALPFFVLMALAVAAIYMAPNIVTYLPTHMGAK